MNRKRKMQTNDETLCRREANKLAMKRKQLCETDNEALCRRAANKLAMKRKQLCDNENETLCRRESDRLAKKQKREHVNNTIDNAISLFTSQVQYGPDYVCTVFHRMLYKSSVIAFNESKYNYESNVLKPVMNEKYRYLSNDNNEWICKSRHNAMSRKNMPMQTIANSLQLDCIPSELKELNNLELCLISLRYETFCIAIWETMFNSWTCCECYFKT